MANKPELKRAIAGSKIKANDYNYNFEQLNNYIENGIADNALNKYEADREYSKGQWVLVEKDGKTNIYESLIDGNQGTQLDDNAVWKFVLDADTLTDLEFYLENKNLPVFCANSGNVDDNGNADLLYLPKMGQQVTGFDFSGTLTKSGSITVTNNTSNIYLYCWTNGSGGRTGNFELVFDTPIGSPATFKFEWAGQKNARLQVNLIATFDDGTTETIFNGETNGIDEQYSTTSEDKKIIKLSADLTHSYTSSQNSVATCYIYPITQTITVSTSTQAFFKVGGNYPNLVVTNTEKTFEKSYLEPIAVETDGTYNVFISETENLYTLANTIYRQKTEPIAVENDVWLDASIQPYKAYKFNGTTWEDFKDVPIGSMVVEGEIITSVETLPYNNAEVNEPSDTRPAVVVETYKNDTSWYRVYSDGWCEQGGELTTINVDTTTTVSLLKPYSNTNYSVLITATGGKRSNQQFANGNTVESKNTTNFVMWSADYSFGRIWEAKGYIKQEFRKWK